LKVSEDQYLPLVGWKLCDAAYDTLDLEPDKNQFLGRARLPQRRLMVRGESGPSHALVANHLEQPRHECSGDSQRADLAKQRDEGLLGRIFGVLLGCAEATSEALHMRVGRFDEQRYRDPISALGRFEDLLVRPIPC
jgi:hypothetical protein